MRVKRIVLALGVLLALSACDPGPTCERSHTEVQYQTVIGPNGSVSMQPVFIDVCDEYAKPKATTPNS